MSEFNASDAITAIGALAEMTRIYYDGLIKQGFDKKQADEFVKVFIASQFKRGNSNE